MAREVCTGCGNRLWLGDWYVLAAFPGKQFHHRCKSSFLEGFNIGQIRLVDDSDKRAENAYEAAETQLAAMDAEKGES